MARFLDSGTGAPTLLFVHGYGCAKEDWDAQISALCDEFRCIALDLPGHGKADTPATASVTVLAEAVNEVRGLSQDEVILIGHSLGTKVIREACTVAPQNLSGLIFIDGLLYEKDTDQIQAGIRIYIETNGFDAFVRDYFSAVSDDPGARRTHDFLIARARGLAPDFGRDIYCAAVGFDKTRGETTLASIRVPVLVLQSSRIDAAGWRVPLRVGETTPLMERVRRLVARHEIVTVTGSSHFPMLGKPDLVAGEIRRFARSVAGGTFVPGARAACYI